MSTYDYKAGKNRVENILDCRTEVIETYYIPSEEQFTYENGYYGWVSAIFVDIRDSTSLFQNTDKVKVSKIIRSFTSEIIEIFRNDPHWKDIGIRGDCVYAIYSTPSKEAIYEMVDKAACVNSYIRALNQLLTKRNYPSLQVGIGVSSAQELVVKAGRKSSGIMDFVWIGKAVTTASNLSSLGNRKGVKPIVFSQLCYDNFIEQLSKKYPSASSWFSKGSISLFESYYSADLVDQDINKWIDDGML